MAQQTINIGASPNDGTGTPLRTSFDYTNQNFTELYTALGGGVGLPGATTQVIFNDGGTNLAGDAGLVYNKTTDALTVAGLVTAGSATITGDLTVDTNVLKVDTTLNRVGIGTASPAAGYTLDVVGSSRITGPGVTLTLDKAGAAAFQLNASGNAGTQLSTIGTGGLIVFTADGIGGALGERYRIDSTGISTWSVAGTTAMTLNSTGLGIGVAPVTDCKLTVRGGSIFDRGVGGGSPQLLLSLGASSGGNYGQISNTGTRWALGFGSTLTTVGTEALIWDSSGNVGIGVTPSAWDTNYKALQLGFPNFIAGNNGGNIIDIGVNAYFNTDWKYAASSVAATRYRQVVGVHQWYTAPSGTAGNAITFTQAMTLDASGNLLVGRTSALASERLHVEGSVTSFVSRISNTSATTPSGLFVRYSAAAPNDVGNFFLRCDDTAATRFELRSNGGLGNYSANNVNLSDARTKTDIKPLTSYWNKIKALELVTFKYKDQTHDDDNIGLISQQVESVAPEFVSNEGFGETPADGVPLKSIYTTDLYHAAIKALQEAMTRIEVLESKLA